MPYYDVFNGDADGLCALQQLRLKQPQETILVTGVKRDINLLKKVIANKNDQIIVLDISLDKNRQDLQRLLDVGVTIDYFDHHYAGDIPSHSRLQAHIDTNAMTCTSLLVNDYCQNEYLAWAVTGAFGDNLYDSAEQAAQPLALSSAQLASLKQLGTYLNYNGYGAVVDDLHYHPADLFKLIQPYKDPFDFINNEAAYQLLNDGYHDDMTHVQQLTASVTNDATAVFMLPDTAWARRVCGVFGNQLAQATPNRAHALVTQCADGDYVVSVRAPKTDLRDADSLCRAFPTGGGRAGAAGINQLPQASLDAFITQFQATYA
jgi:hypothetical protein